MQVTPLKAIRRKCLECQGGGYRAVRECDSDTCALRPYRLGHYPEHRNSARMKQLAEKSASFEQEGAVP